MQIEKVTHSNLFTILLIVVGLSSIGFGIFRGEVPIMFEKSISICLECIGIG